MYWGRCACAWGLIGRWRCVRRREWILAKAYKAAEDGDYEEVHALQELFRRPFDEQPDKEARYYRKAPSGSDAQGGIGFMS